MAKILIVDDEQEIISLLREFLVRHGYEVIAAHDGGEALEYLNSGKEIDIMILDLKMPHVGGVDVLRHVRGRNVVLPLVVLSGSIGLGSHLEKLVEMGYTDDDIAQKPVSLYALLDRIEKKLSYAKN